MKEKQLEKIKLFVQRQLESDTSGHDFYHIDRVYQIAIHLAEKIDECDPFIVKAGALLHDSADHKLTNPDVAMQRISDFLSDIHISQNDSIKILAVIPQISYSADVPVQELSIESKIIQDADRLDALGALGIARTFTYGGFAGQAMAVTDDFLSDHCGNNGTSVSHFYDKLFKLPETLHTLEAKKIAQTRVTYMQNFLKQMKYEWFSKDINK